MPSPWRRRVEDALHSHVSALGCLGIRLERAGRGKRRGRERERDREIASILILSP
jgi:hypothetical protein